MSNQYGTLLLATVVRNIIMMTCTSKWIGMARTHFFSLAFCVVVFFFYRGKQNVFDPLFFFGRPNFKQYLTICLHSLVPCDDDSSSGSHPPPLFCCVFLFRNYNDVTKWRWRGPAVDRGPHHRQREKNWLTLSLSIAHSMCILYRRQWWRNLTTRFVHSRRHR